MYSKFFLTLCACAVLSTACKKEDNKDPQPTPTPDAKEYIGNYILKTSLKNEDGKSGSSYLQAINKLSATESVDNSKAEQVPYMSSVIIYDNEVYSLDAIDGAYGVVKFQYDRSNGKLTRGAKMDTPAHAMPCNFVKVSNTKAYLPLYNSGTVWIFNPQTMQKTAEIDITSYAHSDNSPDAGFGVIRGDYYYLPLLQLGPDYAPYADHLQSDVLVINTQTDKVEKLISETATHLAMPSQPSYNSCIFMNENKDIYIMCAGYFGFNPQNTHSGLVCIPNKGDLAQTDFDSSKSWDISSTPIEGTPYKPNTIYSVVYLGGGKVAAFVSAAELNVKNPFTDKNGIAVLMDLNTKTIKKIDGIPYTDSHSVGIAKYKDLVVFGVSGKEKRGLFGYNPTTGTTQQLLTTTGGADFFYAFE